jgi:hypothetical protein
VSRFEVKHIVEQQIQECKIFGKNEVEKLVNIIPHAANPGLHVVLSSFEPSELTSKSIYRGSGVRDMLAVAVDNRNKMTGSEFQSWLDGLEAKSKKPMAAEKHFVGWQLGHFIKERSEAHQKKEDAHMARLEQICEYCEVAPCSI